MCAHIVSARLTARITIRKVVGARRRWNCEPMVVAKLFAVRTMMINIQGNPPAPPQFRGLVK